MSNDIDSFIPDEEPKAEANAADIDSFIPDEASHASAADKTDDDEKPTQHYSKLETGAQHFGQGALAGFSDEATGLGASIVDPYQRVLSRLGITDEAPSQILERTHNKPQPSMLSDVGNAVTSPMKLLQPGYLYGNDQLNALAKKLGIGLHAPAIQDDKVYTGVRDIAREDLKASAKEHPWTAGIMEGVGGAASLALSPMKALNTPLLEAPAGSGLVEKGIAGAVNSIPTSAAIGAGTTDAKNLPDQLHDVGNMVGTGGMISAVAPTALAPLQAAGEGAGGFVQTRAPTIYNAYALGRDKAQSLYDKAFGEKLAQDAYAQNDKIVDHIKDEMGNIKGKVDQATQNANTSKDLIRANYERQVKDYYQAVTDRATAEEHWTKTLPEENKAINSQIKEIENGLETANSEAKKTFTAKKVEDSNAAEQKILEVAKDTQGKFSKVNKAVEKSYKKIDDGLDKAGVMYDITPEKQALKEVISNSSLLDERYKKAIDAELKKVTAKVPEGVDPKSFTDEQLNQAMVNNSQFRTHRADMRNILDSFYKDATVPNEARTALNNYVKGITRNRQATVRAAEDSFLKSNAGRRIAPDSTPLVGMSEALQKTDHYYGTLMDLKEYIGHFGLDSRTGQRYANPEMIKTIRGSMPEELASLEGAKIKAENLNKQQRFQDLLDTLDPRIKGKIVQPMENLAQEANAIKTRTFEPADLSGNKDYSELLKQKAKLSQQTVSEIVDAQHKLPPKPQTFKDRLNNENMSDSVMYKDKMDEVHNLLNKKADSKTEEMAQEILKSKKFEPLELREKVMGGRLNLLPDGEAPLQSKDIGFNALLDEYEKLKPNDGLRQQMVDTNKNINLYDLTKNDSLEGKTLHGMIHTPKFWAGTANSIGRGVGKIEAKTVQDAARLNVLLQQSRAAREQQKKQQEESE